MGTSRKKVVVGNSELVNADEALAMLSDASSNSSKYVKAVRDLVYRNHSQNPPRKYFLIDIKNADGSPLTDQKTIQYIRTTVNVKFTNLKVDARIIWAESNPTTGKEVKKFLCVPADKYKDFSPRGK